MYVKKYKSLKYMVFESVIHGAHPVDDALFPLGAHQLVLSPHRLRQLRLVRQCVAGRQKSQHLVETLALGDRHRTTVGDEKVDDALRDVVHVNQVGAGPRRNGLIVSQSHFVLRQTAVDPGGGCVGGVIEVISIIGIVIVVAHRGVGPLH